MGWIGIGALIASISFILYKNPVFWTFAPWWHQAASRPALRGENSPLPIEKPLENGSDVDNDDKDDAEYRQITEENTVQRTGDSESDGSQELTPKASAIPLPTPPTLEIPELSLGANITLINSDEGKGIQLSSSLRDQTISKPPTFQPSTAVAPSKPSSNSKSMPPPSFPPANDALKAPQNSMPPPPRPSNMSSLRPPPSIASALRGPPRCASAPSTSTLAPPLSVPGKPSQPSRQVALEPGHSPLDWAALTSDPRNNLRGENLPPTLIRVTPSMLKIQNGRKGRDAWTSYRGKVYNITPYIPFHPGGKGEILRGAGKDSDKLFLEVHPWVNWDGMLGECLVGILVGENDPEVQVEKSVLDDMD